MKTTSAASPRKKRSGAREDSGTRDRLLDAAETIIREQGYAAVTTRRLGEQAGVTAPLLHYYFKSMDDLFVSLYRRYAETGLQQVKEALQSGNVLQVLWQQNSDPMDAVLLFEFMALSNHRTAVRDEMMVHAEEFRRIQHRALKKYLKDEGIETSTDSETLLMLMAGTGLLLALESKAGLTFGHNRVKAFISDLIKSPKN